VREVHVVDIPRGTAGEPRLHADAEERELKTEPPPVDVVEIAGIVPPFVARSFVRTVVGRKDERITGKRRLT
jgi:hypothetical protein